MKQVDLLPKQRQFVLDRHRFSCYTGGYGSGKTVAGCLKGLLLSQLMPGNYGLVGRLTYPELRDTTRKTFLEVCPTDWYDEKKGGIYKESDNYLRLMNGSEVIFRHLDKVSQKEILSLNLGWFFIDQAEEISEEVFLTLISRLRLDRVPAHYGFIVANHEGHNWIWKRFKKEPKPDTFLTEASSRENPHLPKGYIESLEQNYSADWVKRYIDGSWDVFIGQIFEEFNPQVHLVDPFQIPESWEKMVSIDHGLVNPTAALYGAVDYDDNIFIYDEYYQANDVVSNHAKKIWEKVGEDPISTWIIDPSTRAKNQFKNGMPWSIIDEYNDYGIFPIPANNEVLASINRIKEYLRPDPRRINPLTQLRGSPRLFIFKNCINLIDELQSYHWKTVRVSVPLNEPEKPQKVKDHAVDALRYMIMTRPEASPRLPRSLGFVTKKSNSSTNEISQSSQWSLEKDYGLAE